ncbi:MAG: hypothetical protein ABIN01_12415 [Ferruginibacter sp.]
MKQRKKNVVILAIGGNQSLRDAYRLFILTNHYYFASGMIAKQLQTVSLVHLFVHS